MRILVGHSRYRSHGGEDQYVDLLRTSLADAHEVGEFIRDNADLVPWRAAATMLGAPQVIRDARTAVSRFRPDVIHLHNVYPSIGPALHLAARDAGVPIVMTVHNFRLRCPNGLMYTQEALCRRCEKGNYLHGLRHDCFPTRSQAAVYATVLAAHRHLLALERLVAAFVVPSDFMRERLLEWGIAPERVHRVPHPLATRPVGETPLGEYGLFLGRLREEKGPQTILPALARAGDPPFVFAGSGPLEEGLRREAQARGLHHVQFLGWQPRDQADHLLRSARYVVMPSRFEEPAGLVALEAVAAGRPLIVSDRGALPEVAEAGAAIAVPADDVEALGTAIRRLASDDELASALAAAARRIAATARDPHAHVRMLEEVYRRVC